MRGPSPTKAFKCWWPKYSHFGSAYDYMKGGLQVVRTPLARMAFRAGWYAAKRAYTKAQQHSAFEKHP